MATLHSEASRRDGWWVLPISWRAILAGLAVAIAVQLVLSLLGTGIGFSFVEPAEPGGTPSAEAFGIGASLWWIVSWIFSLTAGTIVAVLSSDEVTRCRGALLGIVIWALATIAGACLFTNLAGGVFKTTAGALGVAGSSAVAGGGALLATNGTGNELMQEIEAFFRNAKDNVDQQVVGEQRGRSHGGAYWHALSRYLTNTDEASRVIDRDRVVTALADAAGVSREQADEEVRKLEEAYAAGKERAKEAAEKAAEAAAQFALWATLGFLLSLVAAVVAGALTARSVAQSATKNTY
ncbi:hypothetical protein [Methylobacillus flagellatus]|uniref:Transmembrane protein n=1 Tax=Methylobacillus flagellatus (strain ATCC 51484 / DSM 6875 / VKM B-1610 / KT) TaxID=265072 RepID=Q1H3Y5_METFK|nr:hypothetical protein [Methylobacillus flagellatus]ABE48802.1 conserved hypothetical protein [Methylobacillus flagellatus KT]